MDYYLLFSSFGQTAIFLLGGLTKETDPVAVYLHSGDICIMSNECRLAYHAVPRIVPAPKTDLPYINEFVSSEKRRKDSEDFSSFERYLETSRINMNVRQVLQMGQSFPDPKT